MNRKALLITTAIASTALLTTTLGLSYARGNASFIPANAEKTEKSFTFEETVGENVWMPKNPNTGNYSLKNRIQDVATGIGTPIHADLDLPYEKNATYQAGRGQFFLYETNHDSGTTHFAAGVNNLQSFEIKYRFWLTDANLMMSTSTITIGAKFNEKGTEISSDEHKRTNKDKSEDQYELLNGTVYTYTWNKPAELSEHTIDEVAFTFSFSSARRLYCDTIQLNWLC